MADRRKVVGLRFRVLGPLEVFDGTAWVGIGAASCRSFAGGVADPRTRTVRCGAEPLVSAEIHRLTEQRLAAWELHQRLAGAGDRTVVLPISSLVPADSPRLLGEDADNVQALAEIGAGLPPILVHPPRCGSWMECTGSGRRLGAVRPSSRAGS